MRQWESTAKISTLGDQPISQWSQFFLIVLPFLILGSRVSSDTTASFCAAFLAIFWFLNPQHVIRKQIWFKVFLVLWLFMCVSSSFAADPKYVFIQSLIAIRWPAFGLVLTCLVFTSENKLKLFERAAFALFGFIALDSILQYFIGQDIFGHVSPDPLRLTGPFTKLLPGSYGLRIYPIALFALIAFSKQLSRKLSLVLMISLVALSEFFAFLTGERVVFILFGFVNLCFLIALIYQEKLSYKFVLTFLAGFGVLAVTTIMLAQKMFERTILSVIEKLSNFQDSTSYPIYRTAYHLWEKSPWMGVGTRYYYQSCQALPFALQPKPEGCTVHVHQIYGEWLTQNGIIGLALFLIVLFFIFKILWQNLDFKNKLLESTVIFVAPVMLFFPFTPSMSMQTNNYAGLVWMLVAWAMARAIVQGKNNQRLNLP